MQSQPTNFCSQCGAKLLPSARFCSQCGVGIDGAPAPKVAQPKVALTTPRIVTVALITVAIVLVGWSAQASLAGKPPTVSYDQASAAKHSEADVALREDPTLVPLRAAVAANPNDPKALHALAAALLDRANSSNAPSQALVFEMIETLSQILGTDPKDKVALVTMADISFNQQVFSKAAEYFNRYLELAPDDHAARSRYGSTLTFLGRYPEAISQLEMVLNKEPKNFGASAYLSITYAQQGERAKALSAGEQALALAPNAEAKERFQAFLDSIQEKLPEAALQPPPQQPTSDAANTRGNIPSSGADPTAIVDSVVGYIQGNTIAGPKFVKHQFSSGKLTLVFKDFPMEGMPPFVREKFLNSIKAKAAGGIIDSISIVEQADGREMAKIEGLQ